MKDILIAKPILAASLALCLVAGATAQTIIKVAEADKDFGTGRLVGECFLVRCQIFVAELLTDSPQPGGAVEAKVVDGLWRIASDSGTLRLPYADRTYGKYETELAHSWANVKLSRGLRATIILAQERMRAASPGNPVWVTEDSHASAVIRSMVAEASRSEAPTYSVSDAIDSLSREKNPGLAGFLFEYLTGRTTIGHPEVASPLLVKLLGSSSVPDTFRELVVLSIVGDYYRLPQTDRMAAVGQLAEIAQQPNPYAASAALGGLGRIAGFDKSAWAFLTPTARSGAAAAYRDLRAKGLVPKTETLELGLDVR